jgi:Ca2+-binding EF-hand superfamily protein
MDNKCSDHGSRINLFSVFLGIDDDRRLDLTEFQAGLTFVGLSLSAAEAEAEFRTIDKNGGGVVLFDEFCLWYAEKQNPGYRHEAAPKSASGARPPSGKPSSAKPRAAAAAAAHDDHPDIDVHEFDKLEAEIQATVNDPDKIGSLWSSLDLNGNGAVSLAEIDKM